MLMFVSELSAQTASATSNAQPSMLMNLAPIAIILGAFYFLILRPQNKRAQQHKEMIEALRRGDKVIALSGLVGTVEAIHENGEVDLLVGTATLRVLKSSISQVFSKPEPRGTTEASKAAKLKVVKKK